MYIEDKEDIIISLTGELSYEINGVITGEYKGKVYLVGFMIVLPVRIEK